jgi:cytochrome oxidase Cu insertion factor (SCO1/SenC/PrrC family)
MRNIFLVMMILATATVAAQTDNEPAYKRYPTVPPLHLLSADSTVITKESLTHNKPTIIMYFNPLCDHCQHQMEDMIKRMDEFNGIQIVMATYAPMNELTDFIAKYKLDKYPNIASGRDTRYMLQPFYKMTGLPYQALYDAKGNLVTTFEGNVKIDTVLNSLKKKD